MYCKFYHQARPPGGLEIKDTGYILFCRLGVWGVLSADAYAKHLEVTKAAKPRKELLASVRGELSAAPRSQPSKETKELVVSSHSIPGLIESVPPPVKGLIESVPPPVKGLIESVPPPVIGAINIDASATGGDCVSGCFQYPVSVRVSNAESYSVELQGVNRQGMVDKTLDKRAIGSVYPAKGSTTSDTIQFDYFSGDRTGSGGVVRMIITVNGPGGATDEAVWDIDLKSRAQSV